MADMGCRGCIMGGMLCKIVPFLVWMKVYGPLVGREPVLPPSSLAKTGLERAWLIAHGCALGLILAGVLTQGEILLLDGGWVLAAGTVLFLCNQGWVLSHLWKRKTTVSPIAQKAHA